MDGKDAIDYILNNNIPGDIVECGCGNGNFEIMWIQQLQKRNALRNIRMYDTFAGLTEPSEKDFSVTETTQYTMSAQEVKSNWLKNVKSSTENNWCSWSVDYVKNILSPLQYPNEYLHYIVGDVRKTLMEEKNIPDKIAILRLDTDWYDSSKIELIKLFPKVVPGGLVIFDDYNHWNGQRQATNEYFAEIGESYTLIPVTDKVVAMIKLNPKVNKQSIQQIFESYSNRETTKGTDKTVSHSYGQVYDNLFLSKREQVTSLLEIGISGGYSLLCYAEYFRNAKIYGVDIEDHVHANIKHDPRIQLFFEDAHKDSLIQKLPTFDIIIEDASHELRDQITHFVEYQHLIKPDGIYVIEDVNGNCVHKLLDVLTPFAMMKGFRASIYDGREKTNRGDDILIIFHKTPTTS